MLALRTPRASYAAVAEDFFLAVSSLAPVEVDEARLNGESHQVATIAAPVAARVAVPTSYSLDMDASDPRVCAFSGDQQPIAELPDDPAFGKLTFMLAQASMVDHPAKAAALYLHPLMRNPITLGGDEFLEEKVPPPAFAQSWLLVAPATFNPPGEEPVACEMRCRVMTRAEAWFIAGVIGPARQAAPIAWMRNKRALDLVSTSIAF
jgi:hypothetical protein